MWRYETYTVDGLPYPNIVVLWSASAKKSAAKLFFLQSIDLSVVYLSFQSLISGMMPVL